MDDPKNSAGNTFVLPKPPGYGDRPTNNVKVKLIVALVAGIGVLLIVGVLGGALFIRGGLSGDAYKIPTVSMTPTLKVNDRIYATKIKANQAIQRGWVVVFAPPALLKAENPKLSAAVKRIVAIPGDTIEARNGVLFVNGRAANEPYLAPGTRTTALARTTLGPGQYYVLGDNREDSADSRLYGPLARSLIRDHVTKVTLPFSQRNTKLS